MRFADVCAHLLRAAGYLEIVKHYHKYSMYTYDNAALPPKHVGLSLFIDVMYESHVTLVADAEIFITEIPNVEKGKEVTRGRTMKQSFEAFSRRCSLGKKRSLCFSKGIVKIDSSVKLRLITCKLKQV